MKPVLFSLIIALINCNYGFCQEMDKVGVLALVEDTFEECELYPLHTEVNTKIGNIITLRVNKTELEKLNDIPSIKYWKIADQVKPTIDRATKDLRVDQVHQGIDLPEGYTGKDVIIGITDWGFDYTHPTFYDTGMNQTRIIAAWDQFKKAGPHPEGFDFGTEHEGQEALLKAGSDTSNVYSYGTHGTHVAGIAGGNGYGSKYRGIAYDASFLFVTFLVDEAAVIDAISWMKMKADKHKKRLVVNMSWGLYFMGGMDGTSLVNQAFDEFAEQGIVFVTSAGNNGARKFHIKKEYNKDTLKTGIQFYPYSAHKEMWGQSISMWGQKGKSFWSTFTIYDARKNLIATGPKFETVKEQVNFDSFILVNKDTIFYRITSQASSPLNQKPHMRLRIKKINNTLSAGLVSSGENGIVHYWNVVELKNDVGNWGQDFTEYLKGWTVGDAKYSVGTPAAGKTVISVAAHSSEYIDIRGNLRGGSIASFSSIGPTVDERVKPDLSAPGTSIGSSVSSFTDSDFTSVGSVEFKGRTYHYAQFSGTSMSSPATAGVAALVLSANPSLNSKQVKDIMIESAREDTKTGTVKDTGSIIWGYGKVTAIEAVKMALATQTQEQEYILYPNPVRDLLFYGYIGSEEQRAKIFSNQGELLLEARISNDLGIDISSLASGLYFIEFGTGDVRKFFIK